MSESTIKTKTISAEEFDRRFDAGEDISEYVDWSKARRPGLELKGFGKIRLLPGKSGTVTLSLPAAELRFLGADLEPVFEPGEVEVLVGPCAGRAQLLCATVQLAV